MQINHVLKPTVTIYHDCRRKLKTLDPKKEVFPVKIIVTFNINGKYKQDPYKTGVALSKKDFDQATGTSCPQKLQDARRSIFTLYDSITRSINEIQGYISPELLRNRVTGQVVMKDKTPITYSVKEIFTALIKEYHDNGQIGTRNSYSNAMNCFLRFGGEGLLLTEITIPWLIKFEKWALSPIHKRQPESKTLQSLGITTIGIYLRYLRRVMNVGRKNNLINDDQYPFGEGKYVIRSEETVKFALDSSQKETVFSQEVTDPREKEALAFWMFSYYCHGMNFVDMAHLRPERVLPDRIVFVREKTKRTVKNIKPHDVPLRAEVRAILKEYGNHKPYCFGIIDDTMNPETKFRKIKQWERFVNRHMNKIAKRNGIPFKVNTYNARHTMAKQLIEKGVHLQYIQEILTHTLPQTTQVYTRGMNIDKAKDITDLL